MNNFEVIVCRMLKGDEELRASVVERTTDGKLVNELGFVREDCPEKLADKVLSLGSLEGMNYRTRNEGVRIKKSKSTGNISLSKSSCGKMSRYQFDTFTHSLRQKMQLASV
ncbi:MAG: hypothetical protein MRY57_03255 [Candidatus Pacebacteria bacterium]|nr:hypothetical protein [Candidatus Paceibacterota bacterium]